MQTMCSFNGACYPVDVSAGNRKNIMVEFRNVEINKLCWTGKLYLTNYGEGFELQRDAEDRPKDIHNALKMHKATHILEHPPGAVREIAIDSLVPVALAWANKNYDALVEAERKYLTKQITDLDGEINQVKVELENMLEEKSNLEQELKELK